jgi:FAD/FMN-containing dehydrogenase
MAEKELVKIVGYKNVLCSKKVLEAYSQDLSFVPRIRPRCVVKPANTAEIQEIVKWANETLTTLVPVSSGPPHFRGDTVPSVGGAVIVDLSRMKRVIRVDPRNRVAMVEPGVTFAELQTELEKAGLCAYMPLAPRSTKSVIGSILEREPITMPAHHWDCTDPMLCAEIIFGTGDKMRSGEAAGPDTIEEQWKIGKAQMCPFGLSQFNENRLISGAQGTMGIITWASMKCRYASRLNRAFFIPAPSLDPLIELSYRLIKIRLGDNCFIMNGLNLACFLGRSAREIKELRDIFPPWVFFISFEGYGELPEEKVHYQEADFKDIAKSYFLTPATAIPGASAEEVSQLLSRPSPEPYWKLRFKGGFQDIFFLTTLDKTPQFMAKMSELAKAQCYSTEDLGVYIQVVVQGTSCHCEFNLYYDPTRPAEVEATKSLTTQRIVDLANMGGFFSRPYGAWASVAYNRVADTTVMERKVKNIFDPNGILNSGKLCL